MKIVECRICGRTLIDGRWVYQINVPPTDEMACCPPCLREEEYLKELEARQVESRTRYRIATKTFNDVHLPADPFNGFRKS